MNGTEYRAICALIDRSSGPVRLVTDDRVKTPKLAEEHTEPAVVRVSAADHDELLERLLAEHREKGR